MFSRLPIKLTAALVLAVPVLIVGLLLTIMWNAQSREAVRELADENLKQLHTLVSGEINDLLSIPPRICRINEQLVQDGVLDTEDLQSWWPIYSRQFASFEMLSSIVWGDADGRSLWISRYSDGTMYWALKDDPSAGNMYQWRLDADGRLADEPPTTFEYDLMTRPWFQAPINAGGPAWTDPFIWVGGDEHGEKTLGISHGIPLYDDDGAFKGIVDADLSLNDLSDFLGSIAIGSTGMSVLIDENGRMLATSSDIQFINPEGERLAIDESDDPRAQAIVHVIGDGYNTRFSGSVDLDGSVYYLQLTPVGEDLGLDWTLASIAPEQDFLAQIDAGFRQSSIVSLIAVLLAILVGILSARWLVNPLRTLAESVHQIRQGSLDTRVDIRHAPEYVELGDAINDMSTVLRDRIHVRERLEATTQSTLDAIVAMDPRGRIVEFNRAAEEIFGYRREDVINKCLSDCIIPPDLRDRHSQGLKHYQATGEGPVLKQRIEITGMRSDQSIFPIELAIVPFEFKGETHFTATIRDMTDEKEKQKQLEESRRREALLRRELDHRVKNMLSQIVALSRQTADRAGDEKPLVDALVGKISSLSGVHELIGKCGHETLQFNELVQRCCEPYLSEETQLEYDGEDLYIHPNAAMCLSLVCNELANNACKYGSLKNPGGRVEIKWSTTGGLLTWRWKERNGNMPLEDAVPGFGTQLIESLIPFELDGEVDVEFTEEGLVFEARIPIENIVLADRIE